MVNANNKFIGTEFEDEFCGWLQSLGYWVHFITPNVQGAQPFDVICSKNGNTFVFDCKTCEAKRFNISRLEENQRSAFDLWLECGNSEPVIAVKHKDNVYLVKYTYLVKEGSVKLNEQFCCGCPYSSVDSVVWFCSLS